MLPLKNLCTIAIGGPARFAVEVHDNSQMQAALAYCQEHKLVYVIIGKGSNCLFSDEGFDGVAIINKINYSKSPEPGVFHVGAGYSFAYLGIQTARQGWSGLEFASGIPASVGGAVYMNAGASGSETCDVLHSIDYIDENGTLHVLNRQDLQFSYRHSPFQKMNGAIVGATFKLFQAPLTRQKQLEIVAYRKKTQPYGAKSAGCIFRNPDGAHAGKLIESAGLKGLSLGGAQVSPVHANFIVNTGDASASELLELMKQVKNKVKEASGYDLQSELCVISASGIRPQEIITS